MVYNYVAVFRNPWWAILFGGKVGNTYLTFSEDSDEYALEGANGEAKRRGATLQVLIRGEIISVNESVRRS